MHDIVTRLLTFGMFGSAKPDDSERLAEIVNMLGGADTLAALTDDEIVTLDVELRELADRILDGTAAGVDRNDTERLTEIAESLDVIHAEAAVRVEAANEQQAKVDEIVARIRGEQAETDPDAPADDEPAADESDENDEPAAEPPADAPAEADAPEAVAVEIVEPEVVMATAPPAVVELPTMGELAARVQRRQRIPQTSMAARTEHPFIRALERGGKRVTLDDLAELFVERYEDFAGTAPGEGELKFRLGRVDIRDQFGSDRWLSASDTQFINDSKIDAVTAGAMLPSSWTDEIVASGGFCAPTPALYDLDQISGSQRPVRDGLPRFGADRGGVRFTPPPHMSDVLVAQSGGAVGAWTNATDLNPGGNTKSCQTVTCQTVQEVLTQAIYTCLQFGNFGARAFPEWVRAWTLNTAAAWARFAETQLMNGISASCTQITDTGLYGFVPELLAHILQLGVGERSRQRMAPDARLRVMLPSWVIAQMQIDYLRQGSVETVFKDEASLRSMFSAANVNVTFYEDERTGAGQIVGAQGQGVGIRDLPKIVEWYMFNEGAFTMLDGGTLDLGLVRDSTLNTTNNFRIFSESWEGVMFRGMFAYRVRDTLCPSGDRQVAVDGDPCATSAS